MDFVGELNRYAVLRATERDFAAVKHARDTVDQLLAAFMQFDWRNGNLRRKYDAVRASTAAAQTETLRPELARLAPVLQRRRSCIGEARMLGDEGGKLGAAAGR
jgi:predicted translin family RNA/ssDNA-binding protein